MTLPGYEDIVALTGMIGTGKSTVCSILEELGARVVSADELAREVVKPGSEGWQKVVNEFGSNILDENGHLNRNNLGEIVFSCPAKRKKLEAITHPLVGKLALAKFKEARRTFPPLIIYECPLLFEAGLDKENFRKIVLITADEKLCLERAAKRSKLSPEAVKKRLSSQLPLREKIGGADIVLDNSGSLKELREKVIILFKELCADRREIT
ncbi:MAG: dephospho-CoA kinase [Deltaproteobacteria bacterium]|nr:dephospho-CoA kinase [Deltaproteobacteria bacterium]